MSGRMVKRRRRAAARPLRVRVGSRPGFVAVVFDREVKQAEFDAHWMRQLIDLLDAHCRKAEGREAALAAP